MAWRVVSKPPEATFVDFMRIHSLDEAVREFRIGRATVVRWLRRLGLTYESLKHGDCPGSFTPEQSDAIVGSLLGDGFVTKQGNFRIKQRAASRAYLEEIRAILGPFGGSIYPERQRTPIRRDGRVVNRHNEERWSESFLLQSFAHTLFKRLRVEWYGTPGHKAIPDSLALNDRVVAHWFVQDGYSNHRRRVARISACCFTREEGSRLHAMLRSIGLGANLAAQSGKPILEFQARKFDELIGRIGPFIASDCFRYKVDPSAMRPE